MSRFSSLARGRGAWTGELELDLYVDMEKEGGTPFLPDIAADETCGQKVATITRAKSAGPPPSLSSSREEKIDGELVLPKTFMTRSGALFLFTAPTSVQLSTDQKQLLKKGIADARGTQLQNKFGTLAKFAQSVLSFGEQPCDEATGAPSPREDLVYLDFLRQLDNSSFVDLHAKPGADPSFYLQDLRSRASSASTTARQRGHGATTPSVVPGDAQRPAEGDTAQMLSADAERLVQLYSRGEFSRCGSAVSSTSQRSQGLTSEKPGVSLKSSTPVGARPVSRGSDQSDWTPGLTPHPPDGELTNSRPASSRSRPLSRASTGKAPVGHTDDRFDAYSVGDGYAPALSDYRPVSRSPGDMVAQDVTGAAQPLQAPYTAGLLMVSNGGSFSMTNAVPQNGLSSSGGLELRDQDAETVSTEQESLPPTTITVEIRNRRPSQTSSHSGIASEQAQSLLSGNQQLKTSLEDITLECCAAPDPNVVDLLPHTLHSRRQDGVAKEKHGHHPSTKAGGEVSAENPAHAPSVSFTNDLTATYNHSLITPANQPPPLLPDMCDHPESALVHSAASSHAAPPAVAAVDGDAVSTPKPTSVDSGEQALQNVQDRDSIIKQILARASTTTPKSSKPKRTPAKKSGKKTKKQKPSESTEPVMTAEERVAKLHSILDLQEKLKQQGLLPQQGSPRTEDVSSDKPGDDSKPVATEGAEEEKADDKEAGAEKDSKGAKGKRKGMKSKLKQKGQKTAKDENLNKQTVRESGESKQDVLDEPLGDVMEQGDEISLEPGKGIAVYEQPGVEESEEVAADESQADAEVKEKGQRKARKGRRRWSRVPDRGSSKNAENEDEEDGSGSKASKGKSGKKVRIQEPAVEEEDDLTEEERHRMALESDNLIFSDEAPSEDGEAADAEDKDEEDEEGQKKSKKSKKEKKENKEKELAKERELLHQRKQEEIQRRLMGAQSLQNQIREKEHELAVKEEKAMKRKKVLEEELAYMAAQAEEARLAEQEARDALAEARRIARAEREAKRKAEIDRKKKEAMKRREEERRINDGADKNEHLEEEQAESHEEDWVEDEEQRMKEEAEADEERFSQLEREAEEEVMARLVQEREEAEKKRRELELEAQKLAEEEEEERRLLEAEQRHLEAIQLEREEEERQKQEEEKRRLLDLQRLEEEEREKLRQDSEKRRQSALVRREQNLESRRHIQGLAKEQGITRPWTFSYFVHWPKDNYDMPMDRGYGGRKKRPKKGGKKGKKKKK